MKKERLDVLMVQRNLAESREKAKALIMSGIVYVNGQKEDKAGTSFEETVQIEVRGSTLKYVSRGGLKLEKAMSHFGVGLEGKVCMDVGASTGGFTDCMLQNGAAFVYAVDVGTNQLAWKLRQDERVKSMEKTNIRYVTPEDIGELVDFVSIDVAFISLTKVLEPVKALMKDGGSMVCLIMLANIISAEARGEPFEGQVAVGAVVLNRVEHPSFPDTLAGVVYQPGAFTAITDGQINEAVAESAKKAAREALAGSDPSGGALYYYNPDKTSNKWIRTRPVIKRIGAHLFCS